MFGHLQRIVAVIALSLFCVAQVQGWSLFEDRADGGRGGSSGGRVYHK